MLMLSVHVPVALKYQCTWLQRLDYFKNNYNFANNLALCHWSPNIGNIV